MSTSPTPLLMDKIWQDLLILTKKFIPEIMTKIIDNIYIQARTLVIKNQYPAQYYPEDQILDALKKQDIIHWGSFLSEQIDKESVYQKEFILSDDFKTQVQKFYMEQPSAAITYLEQTKTELALSWLQQLIARNIISAPDFYAQRVCDVVIYFRDYKLPKLSQSFHSLENLIILWSAFALRILHNYEDTQSQLKKI